LDVDALSPAGVWFRQVPARADALYRPPHPADNRWQRGTVVDALYFADSEPTAWAEWYRALAEAALPPQQALPRDLWRWEISLSRVADLSDETRLNRVGLPPLRPTRTQWPDFQAVGEQLHAAGWAGLLSASAARPEGLSLCIFRTTHTVPGAHPLPPPTTVLHPPVVPTGLRT
jgi:RES domain-containing protein